MLDSDKCYGEKAGKGIRSSAEFRFIHTDFILLYFIALHGCPFTNGRQDPPAKIL